MNDKRLTSTFRKYYEVQKPEPQEIRLLALSKVETHAVLEICKAHREHCAKIRPELTQVIAVLDSAIAKMERFNG